MKSKKGFTLIELLAVIVILGILMIAAIPSISNAITKSRKDTYVTNAKKIIDAARTSMASGEVVLANENNQVAGGICQYPDHNKTTVINLFNGSENVLPYLLERGGAKSSFGQTYKAGYVIIYNKGSEANHTDYYDYYISLVDNGGNGISTPIKEDILERKDIQTSIADLNASNVIKIDDETITNRYNCVIQK